MKQDPDLSIGIEGRGCLAVDTALDEIGCEEIQPFRPIQSPTKRPLNPMDRSVVNDSYWFLVGAVRYTVRASRLTQAAYESIYPESDSETFNFQGPRHFKYDASR